MKKKKERMMFAGGVLIVALVVAVLLAYSFDGASAPAMPNAGATTTPEVAVQQPAAQKLSAKPVVQAPADGSVRGVMNGLANARAFATLMDTTGVGATLAGPGPYTVFVPSDTAFGHMAPNFLSSMSAAQKKRLAQYHVVAGKSLDLDAVSSGNHAALSKDMINFNVRLDSMTAYVNSGYAITQHKATNGIVYVVSAVLVPPQAANPSTGSTGTPTPR